jgi:hypothetical protein
MPTAPISLIFATRSRTCTAWVIIFIAPACCALRSFWICVRRRTRS